MTEMTDFIAKHLVEELASDIDPPVRVYLLGRDEWERAPLTAPELRAGWAHAETTGEVAVLRFCPEVMAEHMFDLQLGDRTTALRADGTSDPIGPEYRVDSQLRHIELFLRLEIVAWEPGLERAVVIRRAYLELSTLAAPLAARLRRTFDLFHISLQEATTR